MSKQAGLLELPEAVPQQALAPVLALLGGPDLP